MGSVGYYNAHNPVFITRTVAVGVVAAAALLAGYINPGTAFPLLALSGIVGTGER